MGFKDLGAEKGKTLVTKMRTAGTGHICGHGR